MKRSFFIDTNQSLYDISTGVRLCSLAVKASTPVKIEGPKPLLRVVVDATNTFFCLSWFGIIYTLKAVEAGFISKSLCLKKDVKSNTFWSKTAENAILHDIAVSSNTLYGATMTEDFKCNVVVLNKHSFHVLRTLNSHPIPQNVGVRGWQLAGNSRILIVRPCSSDILYVFEFEKFKETIKLDLDKPANWFSMMFSGDYLLLQNFVEKQLICMRWSEHTQLIKSKFFKQKSYLNSEPVLKTIDESDSPVLILKVSNSEYAISRSLCSTERFVRIHDFKSLMNSTGNDSLSGQNVRPFNNDVLGQYDAGKLGLTLLCMVNKSTVLCQEKFEGCEEYSLYLVTVKAAGSLDRGERDTFSRSTTQISHNF